MLHELEEDARVKALRACADNPDSGCVDLAVGALEVIERLHAENDILWGWAPSQATKQVEALDV